MEAATVYTDCKGSRDAGAELGSQIRERLGGAPAAVILFASPRHEYGVLLEALHETCAPAHLVGASSAGEVMPTGVAVGMACALAFRGSDLLFATGVGRGLAHAADQAARDIAAGLPGLKQPRRRHRSVLVLTDALAGHADALVEHLTLLTAGQYQFFGGGAGDNAEFRRTVVFHEREVLSDAAVALEIQSDKPIGIGASHGWQPASEPLRVSAAEGMRLISLDGFPAVEAFIRHAEITGQRLDVQEPIPFFLHNILGLDDGGGYRLRVPLAVMEDGSVHCAAEIPEGSVVRIMRASAASSIEAARRATDAAISALESHRPRAALFFDCVATRLRLGDLFDAEVGTVRDALPTIGVVGCNTHGQIARVGGQFEAFHNCTAVVCVFPA